MSITSSLNSTPRPDSFIDCPRYRRPMKDHEGKGFLDEDTTHAVPYHIAESNDRTMSRSESSGSGQSGMYFR